MQFHSNLKGRNKLSNHFSLQLPHLSTIDIDKNSEFMPILTDSGLCHVLNGLSITGTYSPTERIKQLDDAFSFGDNFQLLKNISGSGFLNQRTFWLDVGEK